MLPAALNVPLLHVVSNDKRVWRFTKDGKYTVKSAYRVAMYTLSNIQDFHVDGSWNLLWELQVPPKVKNFFMEGV